jgi:hypothetical protein
VRSRFIGILASAITGNIVYSTGRNRHIFASGHVTFDEIIKTRWNVNTGEPLGAESEANQREFNLVDQQEEQQQES